MLIHAFIISRKDDSNTFYVGLKQLALHHSWLVQNVAAHILTSIRRHEHITPVLEDLDCCLFIFILTLIFFNLLFKFEMVWNPNISWNFLILVTLTKPAVFSTSEGQVKRLRWNTTEDGVQGFVLIFELQSLYSFFNIPPESSLLYTAF